MKALLKDNIAPRTRSRKASDTLISVSSKDHQLMGKKDPFLALHPVVHLLPWNRWQQHNFAQGSSSLRHFTRSQNWGGDLWCSPTCSGVCPLEPRN